MKSFFKKQWLVVGLLAVVIGNSSSVEAGLFTNLCLNALHKAHETVTGNYSSIQRILGIGEQTVVAVVDPVSSGSLVLGSLERIIQRYLPAGSRENTKIVYIQTVDYSDAFRGTFSPVAFDGGIRVSVPLSDGDLQRIRELNITHIIPGGDMATRTTRDISDHLQLRSNPGGRTDVLKDKVMQQEVLMKNGLPFIASIYVETVADAKKAWRDFGSGDVVIKPNEGVGTEGVFFASTEREVEEAMSGIIDKGNALGFVNHGASVQQRIRGTEYFIDTVSFRNPITRKTEHRIVNIARYRKVDLGGHMPVYASIRILPFRGEEQDRLSQFIRKALDAMEVKEGATHTEIMVQSGTNELKPIEFNFRAAGILLQKFLRQYALRDQDLSQTEAIALGALSPWQFAKAKEGWELENEMEIPFLFTPRDGHFNRNAVMALLEKFPQVVKEVHPSYEHGAEVKRTTDLFKVLGKVILAHPNGDQVTLVAEEIFRMCMNGEFLLPPQ